MTGVGDMAAAIGLRRIEKRQVLIGMCLAVAAVVVSLLTSGLALLLQQGIRQNVGQVETMTAQAAFAVAILLAISWVPLFVWAYDRKDKQDGEFAGGLSALLLLFITACSGGGVLALHAASEIEHPTPQAQQSQTYTIQAPAGASISVGTPK